MTADPGRREPRGRRPDFSLPAVRSLTARRASFTPPERRNFESRLPALESTVEFDPGAGAGAVRGRHPDAPRAHGRRHPPPLRRPAPRRTPGGRPHHAGLERRPPGFPPGHGPDLHPAGLRAPPPAHPLAHPLAWSCATTPRPGHPARPAAPEISLNRAEWSRGPSPCATRVPISWAVWAPRGVATPARRAASMTMPMSL
jgi:hypothetical protein